MNTPFDVYIATVGIISYKNIFSLSGAPSLFIPFSLAHCVWSVLFYNLFIKYTEHMSIFKDEIRALAEL